MAVLASIFKTLQKCYLFILSQKYQNIAKYAKKKNEILEQTAFEEI